VPVSEKKVKKLPGDRGSGASKADEVVVQAVAGSSPVAHP
jgi:hypothetical protein